jgi:hypothetical protein
LLEEPNTLGLVQEDERTNNQYLAEKALVDYLRWVENLDRVLSSPLDFAGTYLGNGSGI